MAKKNEDKILKLSKPYAFEEHTYQELDFSGLDDITVEDMIQATDFLTNNNRVSVIQESDLQYCLYIASNATKIPYEFFMKLRPRDAMKVKNKVRTAFFGEE